MMKLFALPLLALAFFSAHPSFAQGALGVGDAAPCVELNDIQTNDTVINHCIRTQNPGTRFTLLEFFATDCSDCAENLPKLSALNQTIQGTTTTRLIGIDRDATAVPAYVDAHRDLIQFPTAIDSDRAATKAYGVEVTPTVFILDANFTVVYMHEGVFTDADVAEIETLVQ